ncbi:hypothetical protein [Acinetobacter sp.]|uniref:hypothetical protein n=1 Tax=Acinetobacter sp. TaxID=472 RepID=UPI0031CF448E
MSIFDDNKDYAYQLPDLKFSSDSSGNGVWGGFKAGDAKNLLLKSLYPMGTMSIAHFGVQLEPLESSSRLNKEKIELFDPSYLNNLLKDPRESIMERHIPLFDESFKLPWLAQSVDLSILDAEIDSIKAGAFNLNQITGNSSGEIQVNFIETRNATILNSAKSIKNIMFNNGDGTLALPKDYLMRITIFCYDRHSYKTKVFEQSHIVALQAASVPLDATSQNGIAIVPLTFIKMFPMLDNM